MDLLSSDALNKPGIDQIEITLFGRGIGEAIVAHLGGGHWIIVDSCLDPGTSLPVTLKYLQAIGVDAAKQVDRVVATHWHDDHIRGMARTLQACESAKFCCANVLTKVEFLKWASVISTRNPLQAGNGTEEIVSVFNYARSSRRKITYACENKLLHEVRYPAEAGERVVYMWSLSPSEGEYEAFLTHIANDCLDEEVVPKRRAVSQSPNNTAVVILIERGDVAVLLGADLENRSDSSMGWTAVLNSRLSSSPRAECFKVAHHGSSNGHSDRVWSESLVSNPLALVTPYFRGRRRLPSDTDVQRLRRLTRRAYRAGAITRLDTRGYPEMVQRTIREASIEFRRTHTTLGAIRCREGLNDDEWTVECFGAAGPL